MQEEIHKELWDRDEREIYPIQKGIKVNGQKIPDPKLHQRISFLKSAIRLRACAFGFLGSILVALQLNGLVAWTIHFINSL
jgi:hypothetical protein